MEQAVAGRKENVAGGQLSLQDGFTAPEAVEHRHALFVRHRGFHDFAVLGGGYAGPGQGALALVPPAVEVIVLVQENGSAGGGHGAHRAHGGGHVHLHGNAQAAFAGDLAEHGHAGVGEDHALGQGEGEGIFAGLEALEGIHAAQIGIGDPAFTHAGGMEGDFRLRQALFIRVPQAVEISVVPDFAREGAGLHQAQAHAQGFLGGQGKIRGDAGILAFGQEIVVEKVHFLPDGAGHVVFRQLHPHPVGARGQVPDQGFAVPVGAYPGDHEGFPVVIVEQFSLHVPDRGFALHAAAVFVAVLKGHQGDGGVGFENADVLFQLVPVLHLEVGGVAHIALGGQRCAVQAVLGKAVFAVHLGADAVGAGGNGIKQIRAGAVRGGVDGNLGHAVFIQPFQRDLREFQAVFPAVVQAVGIFIQPDHPVDLAVFRRGVLQGKHDE